MFSEYEKGRTPNPDILCNREIKFDSFAEEARKLGGDFVATGHYCRKDTIVTGDKIIYRLFAGRDQNKDQSYFLCQVSQEQLGYALFPIGDLTKPEVRRIAAEQGLATAHRKDSQGICFVGKVHLPTFLQQKLAARKGQIIEIPKDFTRNARGITISQDNFSEKDLELASGPTYYDPGSGRVIGDHNGAHFFTIGQRKGINIGGYREPLFVLSTDIVNNMLFVGEGQSHPGLYRKGLFIRDVDIHWIRRDLVMKENEVRHYDLRIRYRQPLQKAGLYKKKNGIYVIFNKLQRGIAPGQFAAWYDGEELIGSGVIDR
jgi:tRNA-specific 2-thiouridylase